MSGFVYFRKYDKPIRNPNPFAAIHGIDFIGDILEDGEWVCEDNRVIKIEMDLSVGQMPQKIGDMVCSFKGGRKKRFDIFDEAGLKTFIKNRYDNKSK